MVFIDSPALNVVLPALQRDLRASGTDLLWISNAYTLLLAAGILVGASLGALVLLLFSRALASRSAPLNLLPADQAALQVEAAKLGDTQEPASLPPTLRDPVQQAIRLAFVDTFRVTLFICAALARLSAALAALLVDKRLAPATAA